MQCRQCGGPMMAETVIKLRRRWLGFRETRFQGAYCATCKIGVLVENHPPAWAHPDRSLGHLLPNSQPIGVS